jgi:flagellar basal body rod protein FlgG
VNYGLYLSAAGALSSMHRQNVYANNLANMNTVGFKPDVVHSRQRLPERLEGPGTFAEPQWMLEHLGGGLFSAPTRISMAQGNLTETGKDLDVALQGRGLFVVGDGRQTADEHLRFTRDGRFTLNTSGELVMSVNGMKVLDASRRPIRLDRDAPVQIDESGAIRQNGSVKARLNIVAPEAADLVKTGDNLMRLADSTRLADAGADGRVQQGYTESAAVDPILAMNSMMSAAKAAQANMKLIQYHDNILGQTFNTFARVS